MSTQIQLAIFARKNNACVLTFKPQKTAWEFDGNVKCEENVTHDAPVNDCFIAR